MKELYTILQEAGEALREFDPVSFEVAERIVSEGMGSAGPMTERDEKVLRQGEDQTQIPLYARRASFGMSAFFMRCSRKRTLVR